MAKAPVIPPELLAEFRAEVASLRAIYGQAAEKVASTFPQLLAQQPNDFRQSMDVYGRWLIVKICVEVARSDRKWTREERALLRELIPLVDPEPCDSLEEAAAALSSKLDQIRFADLLLPFSRLDPLREDSIVLEAGITRLANIVMKLDGEVSPREVNQLRWLQDEVQRLLDRPLPLSNNGNEAVAALSRPTENRSPPPLPSKPVSQPTAEQSLAEALAELDGLVGLKRLKQDVRELINFLRIQRERENHGLSVAPVSLHCVFVGNPGTGKTTVARILGRVLGALGVVSKGHLVETDRSGLVAGFVGQTGSRTHQKIDEALDGVLFVDEAYSLVAEGGDDAYGQEAVQALLKRMEDDRQRLVVVLAGYSEPMRRLLRSNPGLSSRFQRTLEFPNYTPGELLQILHALAERHHYVLPGASRAKFLVAARYLTNRADEHFGNGRVVRNAFESAIRRLANRIATIAPLTKEILTRLEPDDFEFADLPQGIFSLESMDALELAITCPECGRESRAASEVLARRVRCKSCRHEFSVNWAEPC